MRCALLHGFSPQEFREQARSVDAELVVGPFGPPVSVGGGQWLPGQLLVIYDDTTKPYLADLTVVTAEGEGQPYCSAIGFQPRGEGSLQGGDLRIPLDSILREVVRAARSKGPELPPGSPMPKRTVFYPLDSDEPVRTKRPARDDRHFARVAAVYQRAVERGESVHDAVARAFVMENPSTAAQWIAEARRRGVLSQPPAERQAGGELTDYGRSLLPPDDDQ